MSLSCTCYDDGEWWYYPPEDFTALATKRWRKCCSCKTLVRPGDLCLEFKRAAHPEPGSIEERIWGDGAEVPRTTWFMCEACGDQYMNLTELGFCINLPANMMNLVREYAEMQREHRERKAA